MIVVRLAVSDVTEIPSPFREVMHHGMGSRVMRTDDLEQSISLEIEKDLEAIERIYPGKYSQYGYFVKGLEKHGTHSVLRYAKVVL